MFFQKAHHLIQKFYRSQLTFYLHHTQKEESSFRMISFGGSNYNISFLIREEDKKRALQSLSAALFSEN